MLNNIILWANLVVVVPFGERKNNRSINLLDDSNDLHYCHSVLKFRDLKSIFLINNRVILLTCAKL